MRMRGQARTGAGRLTFFLKKDLLVTSDGKAANPEPSWRQQHSSEWRMFANITPPGTHVSQDGPCPLQAKKACGFNEWIDMAIAPAIEPTLKFFNAIRAKEYAVSGKEIPNIAVFFTTGRREQQRRATLWNLDRAGFKATPP
jgi:HAD superfamily, subfamily IIIB (Acid phosphatase)